MIEAYSMSAIAIFVTVLHKLPKCLSLRWQGIVAAINFIFMFYCCRVLYDGGQFILSLTTLLKRLYTVIQITEENTPQKQKNKTNKSKIKEENHLPSTGSCSV